MIPELGLIALLAAACLGLGSGAILLAAPRAVQPWRASLAFLSLCTFAIAALVFALVTDDFSVAYVASHSLVVQPVIYKITATWGAHEGSLVLWIVLGGLWTLIMAKQRVPPQAIGAALVLFGGFAAFSALTSNPFLRFLPFAPEQGSELNPLLQDIGLIIHPPIIYAGYTGCAAVAAIVFGWLVSGRPVNREFAQLLRPWILSAWALLGVGIALGSWWAYYELGWGGFWFWDPVETASLLPWLCLTAMLHTNRALLEREAFGGWTVSLGLASVLLSLMGTFFVRSGILTSVHAFATDPQRGVVLLGMLALVCVAIIWVVTKRSLGTRTAQPSSPRWWLFQAQCAILLGALAIVLFGTLYPIAHEVVTGQLVTVGAPWFALFFAPLAITAAMGAGPALRSRWTSSVSLSSLRTPTVMYAGVAAITGAVAMSVLAVRDIPIAAAAGLACGWLVAWLIMEAVTWRDKRPSSRQLSAWLGHTGLACAIIGATCATIAAHSIERRMQPLDVVTLGDTTFKMGPIETRRTPNYFERLSQFTVNDDASIALVPAQRTYPASGQVLTEVGLTPGAIRDLYVTMTDPADDGSWAVRIRIVPGIRLLWLGALIAALSAIVAIVSGRQTSQRRKRASHRPDHEDPPLDRPMDTQKDMA